MALTTGATLFCELVKHEAGKYIFRNPRSISSVPISEDLTSTSLSHWMPYSDDIEFELDDYIVYYIGKLNDSYLKFYGVSLMKEEISELNYNAQKRIKDGELSSDVIKDLFIRAKEIHLAYSIKYGIDENEAVDYVESDEAESASEHRSLH